MHLNDLQPGEGARTEPTALAGYRFRPGKTCGRGHKGSFCAFG